MPKKSTSTPKQLDAFKFGPVKDNELHKHIRLA